MVKPYTFKGLRPDLRDRSEHEAYEKKSGPGREAPAEPGHSSGPISGRDVTTLREGIGGLLDQEEVTPVGDDGYIKRVVDEHGRRWLYVRFENRASNTFDWYCLKMVGPGDPGIDVGPGGGIDVGDLPTERSIIVRANSLTIPTTGGASTPRQVEVQAGDVTRRTNFFVCEFSQATVEYAEVSTPLPLGYNGQPMRAFWIWYPEVADVGGSVTWQIEAKSIGDGEDPSLAWGTLVSVTDNELAPLRFHVTDLTPEFTPAGSYLKGDDLQFRFSRAAAGIGGAVGWTKCYIIWERDTHSDAGTTVGTVPAAS